MNSEAIYFPRSVPSDLGIRQKPTSPSVSEEEKAQIIDSASGSVRDANASSSNEIGMFSDESLLGELRVGNKEALAILFRRYARMVRAVTCRILRDESEADDLVQDVFLFVYQKATLFDSERGSARSWIVQIAYHRAIDRRRYLTTRHFYTRLELDEATAQVNGPNRGTGFYEQSIEGVFGRERVRKIAESLSVDQRQVLELYFYEGHTLEEIAKEIKQTVGNARNHYYRGLEKMRRGILEAKLRTK
jgi:RNA polymerase sigma-70 factor (ECF subfamily)